MMWVAWVVPEEAVLGWLIPRLLERMAEHRVPVRPGRSFPRPRDGKPKNKGKKKRKTNKTKKSSP